MVVLAEWLGTKKPSGRLRCTRCWPMSEAGGDVGNAAAAAAGADVVVSVAKQRSSREEEDYENEEKKGWKAPWPTLRGAFIVGEKASAATVEVRGFSLLSSSTTTGENIECQPRTCFLQPLSLGIDRCDEYPEDQLWQGSR